MGTLTGLILGAGITFLVLRGIPKASASSEVQSGDLIKHNGKIFLVDSDMEIHEVIDPRVLSSSQIAKKAKAVSSEVFQSLEEGAPTFCP